MDASTNTMKSKIGRLILIETPIEVRELVRKYADTLIRDSQIGQFEVNNKKIPKKLDS